MSRGALLSYLSADDALLPGAVSEAVQVLGERAEIMMVYGDYELMDSKSATIRAVQAPDFDYRSMVADIVVQPGPGVFFRRVCFERLGGWNAELRQTPDYEYWLRVALLGPILRIPKPLARFRVHEASQSFHSTTVEKSDEIIRVLQSYFERSDLPSDIAALEPRSLAMAYVTSARFHLRAGRTGAFWKRFMWAIRFYPLILFRLRALKLLANAIRHRLTYRP